MRPISSSLVFLLPVLLAPLALLAGCGPAAPVGAAVAVGSIAIMQRSPIDALVSVASGRDCSIVNLEKKELYCRRRDKPPEEPVFCTRSLGIPDCWADPKKLPGNPHEIADGPRTLTPDQEADRMKWWPGLW